MNRDFKTSKVHKVHLILCHLTTGISKSKCSRHRRHHSTVFQNVFHFNRSASTVLSTFSQIAPVLQSTTSASPTKFPGAGDSHFGCHHPGADNPMHQGQKTISECMDVEVMPRADGFNDLKMPGNLVAAPDPRMQRNSS